MASAQFKKLASTDSTRRYSVVTSNLGENLPRKRQMFADEIMTLKPIARFVFPQGVDKRAPLLPGDSIK